MAGKEMLQKWCKTKIYKNANQCYGKRNFRMKKIGKAIKYLLVSNSNC